MNLVKKIASGLIRESKYLLRDIKYILGFYDRFYRDARGSRIMIYHGICLDDATRFNPIFLTLETFEQHLKFYKKYFNVISLADYYAGNFSNNRFNICLSFDDGFANNYKYVLPLLEKYELPATFFITAIRATGYDVLWNDFLGIVSKYGPKQITFKSERYYKGQHNKYISVESGIGLVERLRSAGFEEKAEMMEELYPLAPFKENKAEQDYWLQMTADQLRDLAASPYVTIGAHGKYHNDLEHIDIDSAADELLFTKNYLEEVTVKKVTSFAFPYGTYNQALFDKAAAAGYEQLLAVEFVLDSDRQNPAMRERFTVNPFINTNNQMYATVKNSYKA